MFTSLPDFTSSGVVVSTRSLCHLDSPIAVLDLLHIDFLMPMRVFSRSSPLFAVFRLSRMGIVLFALEFTCPALTSFIRSFVHSGTLSFASDLLHIGLFTSIRSFTRLDFHFPIFGTAWFGPTIFALDLVHLGTLLLFRCPTYSDLASSVSGMERIGISLPMPDYVNSESSMLLRSFAYLEAFAPALDYLHSGVLLILQSFP